MPNRPLPTTSGKPSLPIKDAVHPLRRIAQVSRFPTGRRVSKRYAHLKDIGGTKAGPLKVGLFLSTKKEKTMAAKVKRYRTANMYERDCKKMKKAGWRVKEVVSDRPRGLVIATYVK